ncbi:DUF4158 domain-containing protein [Streptosporangium roseum]
MPVGFLSDDQVRAYTAFEELPPLSDLEKFFFLDALDRDVIAKSRQDSHRLGVAVQIGTVRYKELFLEDPLAVPWPVVDYLAEQLGIGDPSQVKRYAERLKTAYEHAWMIRDAYGYHDFDDHESWEGRVLAKRFRTFLHGRAWTHAEGPTALFDQSVAWLRRHRVLLPGVTVLERLVASVREQADERLYATVARQVERADAALRRELSGLLVVPAGARMSELERLRQAPKRQSGTEMARALQRVDDIARFRLGRVRVDKVPVRRLKTLAKYGAGSKAPLLARLHEPRKTATMLAVTRSLEAEAIDDALDLFALLMASRLISPARRKSSGDRLSMLPKLEKASRLLSRAGRVLVEQLDLVAEAGADLDPAALWTAVTAEAGASKEQVLAALEQVDELVPDDDGAAEAALRSALVDKYNTVRPFLKLLGESKALGAAAGGRKVQVMGIGQMVVPGTPRDSLYILDTLINIDAGPQPEVVTTDQASDSDMVFGIFSMLGYRFAPRFADLGDQRFWRSEVPGSNTPDDRRAASAARLPDPAAGRPAPPPAPPRVERLVRDQRRDRQPGPCVRWRKGTARASPGRRPHDRGDVPKGDPPPEHRSAGTASQVGVFRIGVPRTVPVKASYPEHLSA